jgi:hypothetical protein
MKLGLTQDHKPVVKRACLQKARRRYGSLSCEELLGVLAGMDRGNAVKVLDGRQVVARLDPVQAYALVRDSDFVGVSDEAAWSITRRARPVLAVKESAMLPLVRVGTRRWGTLYVYDGEGHSGRDRRDGWGCGGISLIDGDTG